MATSDRRTIRERLRKRIRSKISGTPERPRLSVFFSGRHVYAQVIDDTVGRRARPGSPSVIPAPPPPTLAAAGTTEATVRGAGQARANKVVAERVGQLIAARAAEKQIKRVVFDRGGFKYHGKVKALADAARVGGLEF